MYTRFLLLLSAFLCVSCNSPRNVLTYKTEEGFQEKNFILMRYDNFLYQEVCYQYPQEKDGYCYVLQIEIRDIKQALKKKLLRIGKDLALVHCTYLRFDYSGFDHHNPVITGTILIQDWSAKEVRLKQNVIVGSGKNRKVFRGKRVFVKSDNRYY